jgi:hypothetical protein
MSFPSAEMHMAIQPLYEFDENWREQIVKIHLEMPRGGRVTARHWSLNCDHNIENVSS